MSSPRPREDERRTYERPHVLIVTDDPSLSEFLGEGLVMGGFWTSVISHGLQVLEVFRLRSFDLIVVDLSALHNAPAFARDPGGLYAQIVYAAKSTDVLDVLCNGRWLMRERRLLTLEEAGESDLLLHVVDVSGPLGGSGAPWLRTGDRQRWKHRVSERRRTLERTAFKAEQAFGLGTGEDLVGGDVPVPNQIARAGQRDSGSRGSGSTTMRAAPASSTASRVLVTRVGRGASRPASP